MIAKVFSAELDGIDAKLIEVETDINVGLHNFTIVGLADKALSEAKERVNSALKNSGVKPPNKENRRIVVNLAPADIKKTGSQYDVAIALGYLVASKQITSFDGEKRMFLGELALNGKLRPINGVLSIAQLAHKLGFTEMFVPKANAKEASIVPDLTVIPLETLTDLIHHLEGKTVLSPQTRNLIHETGEAPFVDIDDIKGQEYAKRALTIAAAGGHNMLMIGSPGTGKTMLAQALNSILPSPAHEEMIEVTQIYSAAGLLGDKSFISYRPFRSPHQSASSPAIMGGGSIPRPGEVSLAHRGVLFLDELPEFRRDVLASLRQPLESGNIHIARARGTLLFPAKFTLVAAMNPCPCGYYGDEEKECRCAAHEVLRYQKKISGPLLDRIDLQLYVPRVPLSELRGSQRKTEGGAAIRVRVAAAREMQRERLKHLKGKFVNAELSAKESDALIQITQDGEQFLKSVLEKAFLSPRGYYRIIKTARTIADLEAQEKVTGDHLREAFGYRLKEQ